jgi:hypothetical protein
VLAQNSKGRPTSLSEQVNLEAERELSPEELALFKSAQAARGEGRFHSLEEGAVMQKFRALQDAVSQRHGFPHYGRVLFKCMKDRPKSPADESVDIAGILIWGRKNARHLKQLREAQEAKSSSAAGIAGGHSSELASCIPLPDLKL